MSCGQYTKPKIKILNTGKADVKANTDVFKTLRISNASGMKVVATVLIPK